MWDQQEPISPSLEAVVSPTDPSGLLKSSNAPLRRVCIVWTHDEAFSMDDVIVNLNQFPTDSINTGDLL